MPKARALRVFRGRALRDLGGCGWGFRGLRGLRLLGITGVVVVMQGLQLNLGTFFYLTIGREKGGRGGGGVQRPVGTRRSCGAVVFRG